MVGVSAGLLVVGSVFGVIRPAVTYKSGIPGFKILLSIGEGHFMDPAAALSFRNMKKAAARDGVKLSVNSSYRTFAKQFALWSSRLVTGGPPTAKPGFSNHQSGTAVDINVGMSMEDLAAGRTTPAFRWLAAHAAAFGFKRTVAVEPWHMDFV